jgi:crossover junction endodeoxyribonuclease RuvC
MFVLGIDPGLSTLGYGVVEDTFPPTAQRAGVIRTDREATTEMRLNELYEGLVELIADAKPDAVAIESVFTNRNLQTAISVGRASGVVMLAAARHRLAVHEYVPTAVKRGVTGSGTANKKQVQQMVTRLLNLAEVPKPPDVADALAIALCHLRAASLLEARR